MSNVLQMRAKTESVKFLSKLITKMLHSNSDSYNTVLWKNLVQYSIFRSSVSKEFDTFSFGAHLKHVWHKKLSETYLSGINEFWHAVKTFSAQNLMVNLNLVSSRKNFFQATPPLSREFLGFSNPPHQIFLRPLSPAPTWRHQISP